MNPCDICKAAKTCSEHQADNEREAPDNYLSACNYRSAEEYIRCTGE